jgi:hypothetical protein
MYFTETFVRDFALYVQYAIATTRLVTFDSIVTVPIANANTVVCSVSF